MNGQPHSYSKSLSMFCRLLGDYFFLYRAINNPMTVNTIMRRADNHAQDVLIDISKNRDATPPDIH